MFETSRRKQHPLQTFRFWFFVMAAATVTMAWKFDLLPFRIGPADTGRLATTDDSGMKRSTEISPATEGLETPFADSTLDLPPVTDSHLRRTAAGHPLDGPPAQSEPAPFESSPFATTPNEMTRADQTRDDVNSPARFEAFADDDWTHTPPPQNVSMSPGGSGTRPATSPIQQTNATTISFDSPDAPDVSTADAPFDFGNEPSADLQPTTTVDFTEIDRLLSTGLVSDEIEAHRLLSTIYWQQPDERAALRERIDAISQRIYFLASRHYMEAYQVQPGDVLQKIADNYSVSWQYLAKLNRVDPKRVRAGQRLKVIKGPFSAIVDLSDHELTIHAHGYYVTRYPIGVGKDGSSPIGKFTVHEKLVDPTYFGPDGVIEHDDPNNPLGERWIDIGNSYGIHGTIDPASIGKDESQGCIRLHNDDVAAVYDLLTIGSEVVIRP